MPLFIQDDDVTAMAEELTRLTKAGNEIDVVRAALRREMARVRASLPVQERLAGIHARARTIGLPSPAFDVKAHTDQMWDDV